MRASHQFIRRQLNQMLPLPFAVAGDREETRIVFLGDVGSIQYVASMPGYLGSGGPQVQLIELAGDSESGVLQFSHALLQGYEEVRMLDRDPVIMLENVESGGFEFLGRDEDGQSTGWTTSWDQPDTLPVAVRLNVEFSGDNHIQWPQLIAGVRIDESATRGASRNSTYQNTIRDLIKGKKKDRSE
jgi:general secretion pathway protein J